jgi:hypothetical protein
VREPLLRRVFERRVYGVGGTRLVYVNLTENFDRFLSVARVDRKIPLVKQARHEQTLVDSHRGIVGTGVTYAPQHMAESFE